MEKNRGPGLLKPFLFRFLAFFTTVVLVLGAVFLVANWQKLNFDAIKRYFAYRTLSRNENGQVDSFPYEGGADSSFARVGDDLLVCSASGIQLYASSGAKYLEQNCHLEHPVLSVGGLSALVYDAGGSELYVYANRQLAFSIPADEGKTILAASLNAQGRLVVVTQASGLKGAVTVYGSDFEPLLGVNLSSRFVTDAVLSPDSRTLALATSGQANGIYESQIAFYAVERSSDKRDPDAICSLGSNVTLKLSWSGASLRVLGETELNFVLPDGSRAGTYAYNGRYLKGYALEGDSFAALILGRYRAGSAADFVTIDESGQAIATLAMSQQSLSLSAAGKYVSLLNADGLSIYTSDLDLYHSAPDPQGARKVLQRADGSVLLIGPETARLHLPD